MEVPSRKGRNHVEVFILALLTCGDPDLIRHEHTDGIFPFSFMRVCAIVLTSERKEEFFILFVFCFFRTSQESNFVEFLSALASRQKQLSKVSKN